MGCKKTVVVLVLLLSLIAASARDPSVGVPDGGKRLRRGNDLLCCDDCMCDWRRGYCSCKDSTENYCTNGCSDCRCDWRHAYFCRCADMLDSCPETCMKQQRPNDAAEVEAQKTE